MNARKTIVRLVGLMLCIGLLAGLFCMPAAAEEAAQAPAKVVGDTVAFFEDFNDGITTGWNNVNASGNKLVLTPGTETGGLSLVEGSESVKLVNTQKGSSLYQYNMMDSLVRLEGASTNDWSQSLLAKDYLIPTDTIVTVDGKEVGGYSKNDARFHYRNQYWGLDYEMDVTLSEGVNAGFTFYLSVYGINNNKTPANHTGRFVNILIDAEGNMYNGITMNANNIIGKIDTEKYDLTQEHHYTFRVVRQTIYSGDYLLWLYIDGEHVPYDEGKTIKSANGGDRDYVAFQLYNCVGTMEVDNLKITQANYNGSGVPTGGSSGTVAAADLKMISTYGEPRVVFTEDFKTMRDPALSDDSRIGWNAGLAAGAKAIHVAEYVNNTGYVTRENKTTSTYHNSYWFNDQGGKMLPVNATMYITMDVALETNGAIQFRMSSLISNQYYDAQLYRTDFQYALRQAVGNNPAGLYLWKAADGTAPLVNLSGVDMTQWHTYTLKVPSQPEKVSPVVEFYVDGVLMGSFTKPGDGGYSGAYISSNGTNAAGKYYANDEYRRRFQIVDNTFGANLGLTGKASFDNVMLSYDAWEDEELTKTVNENGWTVSWNASAFDEVTSNIQSKGTSVATIEEVFNRFAPTYDVYIDGELVAENISETSYTGAACKGGDVKVVIHGSLPISAGLATTVEAAADHTPGAEATCTTAQTCTACGIELAPAKGHTEVTVKGYEALCHLPGLSDGIQCSVCNEWIKEQEVIGELGHLWHDTSNDYAATCEYDAHKICDREGCLRDTIFGKGPFAQRQDGTKLPHTEATREENRVEATCTTDGSYDVVTYCTVCNTVINTEHKTIEAKGHTHKPEEEWICNETIYCSVCGVKVATVSHDYDADNDGEKEIDFEATCTTPAYMVCDRPTCHLREGSGGKPFKYTVYDMPALGHKDENHDHICDNGCGEAQGEHAGTETSHICEYCGEVASVCAPGEVQTEGRVESTCTTAGYYYEVTYCTICGEQMSKTKVDLPLAKHTETTRTEDISNSTCTVAGKYNVVTYCSVCQEVLKTESFDKELAAHTEQTIPAVDATCTAGGFTAGKKCSVCDKVLEAPVATEKLPHTEATREENRVEATLNAPGSYDLVTYCSVCNTVIKTETKEIAQLTGAVAQIGDTFYATLQDAIDAAAEGATVTLLDDVTVDTYIKITKSITLDLGGKTITREVGTGLYINNANAEVVIKNGTVVASDTAIYVKAAKQVDLYCNAICTDTAEAVYLQVSGVVNIYSGTYQAEYAHVLNILDANRATCTINVYGGEFVNFDPANNGAEGTGTNFLADKTQHTVKNGNVYTICTASAKAPVEENRTEATCTTAGSYDMVTYCECGKELSRETFTIKAEGHNLKSHFQVHPKTCTEDGWVTFICKGCGVEFDSRYDAEAQARLEELQNIPYVTIDIIAKGHTEATPVEENRVEATLNAAGSYDMVTYCSVCGEELKRESFEIAQLTGAAASVDGIFYATLQEAIDAAEGKTVKLLADVNMKGVRINITTNCTLDLNGHTLTSKDGGGSNTMAVYVQAGKTFTLADSVGEGKIVSSCYGIYVQQGATFNMTGGTLIVTGNGAYDFGVVTWNATFNMTGGKIEARVGAMACDYYNSTASTIVINGGAIIINGQVGTYGDPSVALVDDPEYTKGATISVLGGYFNSDVSEFIPDGEHMMVVEGIYTICECAAQTPVEENRNEATCTTAGSYDMVTYCECGKELNRKTETIEATGHNLKSHFQVHPKTCTEDGWVTFICKGCGVEFDSRYDAEAQARLEELQNMPYITIDIIAKGHTEETVKGYDATCTEDGLTDGVKCSVCQTWITEQTVIEAKGHRFSSVVTTSATCTEDGYVTIGCGNCGGEWDSRYDEIAKQYLIDNPYFNLAAKGHTEATREENRVEATCTTDGSYDVVTYCTVCNAVIKTETMTIEATGHNLKSHFQVHPKTCTEDGWVTFICKGCGVEFDSRYDAEAQARLEELQNMPYVTIDIIAKGHTEATPVEENRVEATCTTAGSYDMVTYCSVCGAELSRKTEIIEKLPHTEETVKGYDATCTENGLTDGKICSVCGETLVAQEEIKAPGHAEIPVLGKAPTCTEKGLTDGIKCDACGKWILRQEAIKATGHQYGEFDATCTICGEAERFVKPSATVENGVITVIDPSNAATKLYVFYVGQEGTDAILWDELVALGKQYPAVNGKNGFMTYALDNLPELTVGGEYVIHVVYTNENGGTSRARVEATVEGDPYEEPVEPATPDITVNAETNKVEVEIEYTKVLVFYVGDQTPGKLWAERVEAGQAYPEVNGTKGYKIYQAGKELPTLYEGGNYILYLYYTEDGVTKSISKMVNVAEKEIEAPEVPTISIDETGKVVVDVAPEKFNKVIVSYAGTEDAGKTWASMVAAGQANAEVNGTKGYKIYTSTDKLPTLTEAGNYVLYLYYTENGVTQNIRIVVTL